VGNFQQSQVGATYTLTATNSGSATTVAGQTVTVVDTLPAGLTATAISGTGWTCTLGTLTCTRTDALAAAASYPAITVTVNVASNASSPLVNNVSVAYTGTESNTGNNTATDSTVITQLPDLTIAKSHVGNFQQGQVGATYTLTATNSGSAATTAGQTVTVVDTLPAGLTATAISGTGWTCTLGTLTCTRTDALAAAASYPAITVTVTVAANSATSVTNNVSVAYTATEESTANNTASDVTLVGMVVSGTIYGDTNHNSTLDGGESWPAGSPTVYAKLFLQGNSTAVSVQTVTAGTSGAYAFSGQPAGNYTIVLSTNATATDATPIVPSGWFGLENASGQIALTLSSSSIANENFGLYNGVRVSGVVFLDTGVGGGTANNGAKDGAEPGLTSVTVTATNGATVYDSGTTPAGGAFTLYIPASVSSVTITRTATAGYLATGGNVGTTSGAYTRSAETVVFTATAGTSYTGVLFGDVPVNTLSNDNASFVQSGTATYYPHTFVAGSAGTVTFSTSALAAPPIGGWVEAVYYDTTNPGSCTAIFSANYALVTANMVVATGQQLCLLVKESAPSSGTGQNAVTLSAVETYANASPALNSTVTRTDTTTSGSGPIVRVQKTVDKSQAFPNDTLTYTITYTNIGGFPARNMTVNDDVPASTGFVSATCGTPLPASFTACAVTSAPAVGGVGTVTWTFTGTLAVSGTGTVTLLVKVK
jgi:uncharacterized repeat protein (TIGR01451 family)